METKNRHHFGTILLLCALVFAVFSLTACLDYDTGKRTGEELREFSDSASEFLDGVRDGYGGEVCPGILAPGLVIGIGIYAGFVRETRRER